MRRLAVLLLLSCVAACTASPPQASQKIAVFFQEWSAKLDDNAIASVGVAANWAKDHPTERINVSGFAAPQGSQAASISLANTRAQVVVDQLTKDGVDPSRIKLTAHGPVDFTQSAIESRRVDILVGG